MAYRLFSHCSRLGLALAGLCLLASCSSLTQQDQAPTHYRQDMDHHSHQNKHETSSTSKKGETVRQYDQIPPDLSKHKNKKQQYSVKQAQKAKKHSRSQQAQVPSILPPGSQLDQDKQNHNANSKQQEAKHQHKSNQNLSAAGDVKKQSKQQLLKHGEKTRVATHNGQSVMYLRNADKKKLVKQVKSALNKANYRILRVDDQQGDIFVLDTSSSRGKIDEATPLYRMHLEKAQPHTAKLAVYNEKNQLLSAKHAKAFFQLVKNNVPS